MYFQQPNMLWGLLLLAIPLLIHLFHFHRTRTILFPGVFRLTQKLQQARQQKKLEHLLVLMSRMAGICCVVLAFAMPSCEDTKSIKAQQNRVAILFDNSLSMQLRNANGVIIEQARNQARNFLKLLNPETSVLLMTQSSQNVLPGANQHWMNPAQVFAVIDTLSVVSQQFTWNDWMLQLNNAVGDYQSESIAVMVFSDAQKSLFSGDLKILQSENLHWQFVHFPLPADINNLSIDSVWYENQFESDVAGVKLIANVRNRTSKDVETGIQLMNNAKTQAVKSLKISAESITKAEFLLSVKDLNQPLKIHLANDDFRWDNDMLLHPFTGGVWQTKVGVIGQHSSISALFKAQPMMQMQSIFGQITKKSLKGLSALLLLEDRNFSAQEQELLLDFMTAGHVILQVAKSNGNGGGVKTIFGSVKGDWIKESVKILPQGLSHPLFKGIFQEAIRPNTSLPGLDRYFKLIDINSAFESDTGVALESILQLENGFPILVNVPQGYYLWLSDLELGSANFVSSSWFLPIFTQIVASKSVTSHPLYGTIHARTAMELPKPLEKSESSWTLMPGIWESNRFKEKKGGLASVVGLIVGSNGLTSIYTGVVPEQPGYYLLSSKRVSDSVLLAFNLPRNESELQSLEAWPSIFTSVKGGWKVFDGNGIDPIIHNTAQNNLWRLFIWGAAFFFALEVGLLLFTDYIKRKENQTK